ncbi:pentatricopeptide repeat-containing protein At2g03880, mitochondrial [Cryptomeria japonica]|uniref:pentatricopeptide repeat-containing protein At2g03880, mitochondrial n=1 Tax=Cryptomeria japonica TaxID=3369 RepID=UPI0027DA6CED|nr:pentatricopeptide repeat-containing protein At2g03880, mitochondrial [Cryptomeria japonica]XP_057851066.2 pentatricopeptide repeat-containing protein At2g03880, mitochondrial [Cryptomeria japonica]XP_059066750.1 pentatricopeptide repeat-containing protein At2g03880, mitochondrial [Cryptomeria japonica]XP_059066751.1 pentatricopeptide repeat-containing protein At2g03880, mitochondrial [Cryptomeria japonica]
MAWDIKTVCKQGRIKEALRIMQRNSPPIETATYSCIFQSCADKKFLTEAKLLHGHMIQRGYKAGFILNNKIITMYVKCGSLADARKVFDDMPERDVITWTCMISGYGKQGCASEALELFHRMQEAGNKADAFTFSTVLRLCAKLGNLEEGKDVHEKIIRNGLESDVFVSTALVDMYAKCGSLENARQVFCKMPHRDLVSWNAMLTGCVQNGEVGAARKVFEEMPDRDTVSWNTMIMGYAQNGYGDEALKVFQQMQVFVKPNAATVTVVLLACGGLAALEQGKEVHAVISRSGFEYDFFVGNALIGMYSKCGSVEEAYRVFNEMPKQDLVSWTTMILGYATNGYGREALRLFARMEQSGMSPDHVTFVGVLSACCHAGLVDEGFKYFENMSQFYNIKPGLAHYGCMVDLLGRAGRLGEARDFISKMPMEPDAAVWSSLLSACRVHNDIELAESTSEHLLKLEPKNASVYVLLSNLYASARRWDGIEKVRKIMESRSVVKKPGCSWIVVNKQVNAFVGGDRSHPQMHVIYAELERLSGEMKAMGYVPDTTFALNDVEKEQKEHILCLHSEKLAIAFGLINTCSATPIRVIKNLRVCGDCHSAIKFISKIVAREIIVRDASRYHHFKDGLCSCGDYW